MHCWLSVEMMILPNKDLCVCGGKGAGGKGETAKADMLPHFDHLQTAVV